MIKFFQYNLFENIILINKHSKSCLQFEDHKDKNLNSRILTFIITIAMVSGAYAEESKWVPPKLLSIEQSKYPSNELLPDIEAQVEFKATVTVSGNLENISLLKSSGFPPLDQAGLESLKTARFSPSIDKDGKPAAITIKLPVSFATSPSPIERPCLGLNNEITEFKRFNTEAKLIELQSVAVLRGALITGLFSGRSSSLQARIEKSGVITDEIISECKNNPDTEINDVIQKAVKHFRY